MAKVTLTRVEAERAGMLPPVCMQCGAPARTEAPRKYSSFPECPPPPDLIGCLLMPLWLLARAQAKRMTVLTPLCDRHAHGWFTWSSLESKAVTDDEISLAGVSEQFVQALQEHRAARRVTVSRGDAAAGASTHTPLIRVRCRACETLNDEAARFCCQCGSRM